MLSLLRLLLTLKVRESCYVVFCFFYQVNLKNILKRYEVMYLVCYIVANEFVVVST